MKNQALNINGELLVYRFDNGIKLVNPNEIKDKKSSQFGHSTKHTLASLLQLPFLVYLEDTEHTTIQCNEINVKECGFASFKDCKGVPWFELFIADSVVSSIKNDKEVVTHNILKIVEEKSIRQDSTNLDTLSIRMPWYNHENKIIGLFGCSIILGNHPLAESLLQIRELGLLNISDNPRHLLPGSEINSVYLTKREIECLHLTIRGKTAKQLARELGISPRTVEEYLTNIKSKMGVSSKSELIDKTIDLFNNDEL